MLQIFLCIQNQMKWIFAALGCKIATGGYLHCPILVLLGLVLPLMYGTFSKKLDKLFPNRH